MATYDATMGRCRLGGIVRRGREPFATYASEGLTMDHTPGPLLVTPNVRPEVEGMDYMIRSGDAPDGDTTLALVAEHADAVLYAAAPVMLAALRSALPVLRAANLRCRPGTPNDEATTDAINIVRTALRDATGETS